MALSSHVIITRGVLPIRSATSHCQDGSTSIMAPSSRWNGTINHFLRCSMASGPRWYWLLFLIGFSPLLLTVDQFPRYTCCFTRSPKCWDVRQTYLCPHSQVNKYITLLRSSVGRTSLRQGWIRARDVKDVMASQKGTAFLVRHWNRFLNAIWWQQPCVLFHHIGTSTQWYSSGCVGDDIYRFLPASALQPEGPCEMFDAVLVLIFVCCPEKGFRRHFGHTEVPSSE